MSDEKRHRPVVACATNSVTAFKWKRTDSKDEISVNRPQSLTVS